MRRLGSELRTSHKPLPSGRHSGMPIGHPNCTVAKSVPIACLSSAGSLRRQSNTGSAPPDVR